MPMNTTRQMSTWHVGFCVHAGQHWQPSYDAPAYRPSVSGPMDAQASVLVDVSGFRTRIIFIYSFHMYSCKCISLNMLIYLLSAMHPSSVKDTLLFTCCKWYSDWDLVGQLIDYGLCSVVMLWRRSTQHHLRHTPEHVLIITSCCCCCSCFY